jgi:hypothetical protein
MRDQTWWNDFERQEADRLEREETMPLPEVQNEQMDPQLLDQIRVYLFQGETCQRLIALEYAEALVTELDRLRAEREAIKGWLKENLAIRRSADILVLTHSTKADDVIEQMWVYLDDPAQDLWEGFLND